MPVLGPGGGTAIVGVMAPTGAGGGGPAVPGAGAKIPPLADSAVSYEYSYSTGTGPYTLAGAYGSWKTFADSYNDGDLVYYRATDKSGKTEYVVGTFTAGTLTRDIILGSTNGGAPIDWTGRTRVLVHALVQGLPLCTDLPSDGQVLMFDASIGLYCPRDIVFPPDADTVGGGPDDDTCDMQDFDSGVTFTIPLTKPNTQAVCRSTDVGDKTWFFDGSAAGNNGYSLDIKATVPDGSLHTFIPSSGTIGGAASWTIEVTTAGGCNISIRSKGIDNDWIIRCICCIDASLAPPTPPPPPRFYHVAMAGAVGAGIGFGSATTDPPPGPISSFLTATLTIKTNTGIFVGNFLTPARLVAYVYTECLPPPTGVAAAPAVTTITDDQGLVWNRRSAFTASTLVATAGDVNRAQPIRFETWMADSSGLADGTVVNVTAAFASPSFVPGMLVYGVDNAGDWDTDPGMPNHMVTDSSTILPSFPLSTRGSEASVSIFYMTPDRDGAPFVADPPQLLGLTSNPVFSGLFAVQGGAFSNLNQYMIFDIDANASGKSTFSGGGGSGGTGNGVGLIGGPTTFTISTQTPHPWSFYAGGQAIPNSRNIFITDNAGTHFFICNQPGNTGMVEPTWDTSHVGANTYEAGSFLIWTYIGTNFYVAPWYTAVPSWTEPFIGGDHYIPAGMRVTDSARTHLFTINVSSPANARTGLSEPTWNTTSGSSTSDGTVTWNYVGTYTDLGGCPCLVVIDALDRN